jgi:hypothetical protein
MKVLAWVGVACIALMASSCASGLYNSGRSTSSRNYEVADFNGYWQLVPSRSDAGDRWYSDRTQFDNDNDWGTTDPDQSYVRSRYRAWFLPDQFRIDSDGATLRVEDTNGNLISAIDITGDTYYGSYRDQDHRDDNSDARARWISDRQFSIERYGRSGRRVVQTYTLQSRGRQLVVQTDVESDTGNRSYTRVYDRG